MRKKKYCFITSQPETVRNASNGNNARALSSLSFPERYRILFSKTDQLTDTILQAMVSCLVWRCDAKPQGAGTNPGHYGSISKVPKCENPRIRTIECTLKNLRCQNESRVLHCGVARTHTIVLARNGREFNFEHRPENGDACACSFPLTAFHLLSAVTTSSLGECSCMGTSSNPVADSVARESCL